MSSSSEEEIIEKVKAKLMEENKN
jgi:hypothetical protein